MTSQLLLHRWLQKKSFIFFLLPYILTIESILFWFFFVSPAALAAQLQHVAAVLCLMLLQALRCSPEQIFNLNPSRSRAMASQLGGDVAGACSSETS